jgi:hypothetical protein
MTVPTSIVRFSQIASVAPIIARHHFQTDFNAITRTGFIIQPIRMFVIPPSNSLYGQTRPYKAMQRPFSFFALPARHVQDVNMATIDSKESLILLVEKKPLLYDKQLKDYKTIERLQKERPEGGCMEIQGQNLI